MKIVVDVFGGDHAPHEIVKGCVDAVKSDSSIELILTGDSTLIQAELNKYKFDSSKITIEHAPDVITNDDTPTAAIKQKKDSSLVRALEITKSNDEVAGMISAGSTGAILTGAILKIGRIRGIMRPTLASVLPAMDGRRVCLVDSGANVDCKPEYLPQFAVLGSQYMKAMYGIKEPRVAMLSIGTEDKKGNDLSLAAFELVKTAPVKFMGNMEARDGLSGEYDVLVSDGFAGNVFLKSTEGAATLIVKSLKKAIKSSKMSTIGAALMGKAFKELKNIVDYSKLGGAPFLGVEKIVIKSHGSSKADAIEACIYQVAKMAKEKFVENIKEGLKNLSGAENTQAEGVE